MYKHTCILTTHTYMHVCMNVIICIYLVNTQLSSYALFVQLLKLK